MGYTHYWKVPENLDPETFKVWVSDVKIILAACEKQLVYIEDLTLTGDEVFFDGGHETFIVGREACAFAFCKTARKPYDLAVTACLLRFRKHFPKVTVSSDGDIDMAHGEDSDWYPGYALVAELFDEPLGEG